MAAHTGCARQVVVAVDVTIGARPWRNGVHSGQREARAVVIERRVHPVGRVVALVAGLGEVRSDVIGIGRALVVLEMAGDACRAAQAVVVVDVAISAGAWRNGMHSSEHKSSTAVIEG